MDTLELLLHPVRLRIVHAMAGGRIRTTSDLCARLPDVSQATVYRHVGLLVEGGLLEIVDEQRVRGAVERSYRLRRLYPVIDRKAAAAMSLDDHRHGFAAAVAALVAEFDTYLNREQVDLAADSVSYRQFPLWLNQDEAAELICDIRDMIGSRTDNRPTPGRSLYVMSPILFPIDEPSDVEGRD